MKAEVFRIKKACELTVSILDRLRLQIKPGVESRDIDLLCREMLFSAGGEAGLLGYKGFPSSLCISVNHVAAHGIPNDYKLVSGDILTMDLTAGLNGWFGDCAVTLGVGDISEEKGKLIAAAERATLAGIEAARAGGRMGDIGCAIQNASVESGYTVLKNFIGHGIGRKIHEEPAVLHCGEVGSGRPIVPGMVFTIEPILTPGADKVVLLKDGWSVITRDRMPCAQFEHTIAIFGDRTEILTRGT
ncbi:MAG: type I methionyl aminopeptidase [Spirochaetales bacterium]|nr:type I methionyl aminopeptidase [Spirochaetales bacterium]